MQYPITFVTFFKIKLKLLNLQKKYPKDKIMVNSIKNNLSALNAFSKQMMVSSNNVANTLTQDYKKSRAINSQGTKNQVTTTITQINTNSPLVQNPLDETSELIELSNTDITEEMTNQIVIEQGFKANAKVISTNNELIGTIIDIIE